MAAERMPDFKEINRLIESLEMLDRSFQRITAEYEGHEEKVRQACAAQLKKESAEFLKEIPVEELKNSKAGIRISALQSAGYNTLYDLYKAENWKLQNIEGIGEKQINPSLHKSPHQADARQGRYSLQDTHSRDRKIS